MKICLVNNLFAPYNRGGAEKVCAAMINEFQRRGQDKSQGQSLNQNQNQKNEVFLITTKPKRPNLGENLSCRTIYLNRGFYNIGKWPLVWRFFWHIANVFSISTYLRFRKILQQEKPDLVITHNLMGLGFMAARAIKKSEVKHQHFLHDIQLLHPSGLMMWGKEETVSSLPAKVYQALTRFFLGSPDLIISPSHWLLQEHHRRGFFPTSATEIRPLAKIFQFEMVTENTNHDWSQKKKNLFFLGQIESHKGIIFLIEAFKKLADSDMSLTIAGDGSLLPDLQNAHKEDKRIKFLGRLKQEDLPAEMKKADVLIMPSLCYENSPTVILEAQSFGLPVVASRIGGIPEIIGPQNRLFTPGEAKELFQAISAKQKTNAKQKTHPN